MVLTARPHRLRVGFLLTFCTLKEGLEQPTAVNNSGNQNPLSLDAVDDAVAANEPLANRRIAYLRDNPSYSQALQRCTKIRMPAAAADRARPQKCRRPT